MKILNFSFSNLCSYGNKLQSFVFSQDPQLILVQGKNGCGKSTISDAMTFSIYGKSAIRKTKDLPNRFNKNGYTKIEFLTNSGSSILIERGLDPNFSRVSIDGKDHNLPDKRKVDEFIEDELAKIPFNVFSNTISLSINEFKSFVKLSPTDKRQIIDRIFGLEILNDMLRKIKEDVKSVKYAIQTIDSNISNNNLLLKNSTDQLANMESDKVQAKTVRISELTRNLGELEEKKKTIQLDYSSINSIISSLRSAVTAAREVKMATSLKIQDLQEKLTIYDSDVCPHCLSDLTDSDHLSIKEKISSDKTESELSLIKISENLKKAEGELQETKLNLATVENSLSVLETEIIPIKREISKLRIQEIEEVDTSTSYLNKVISTISESLKKATIERNELSDQLKILQELEEIIPGMKQILMNQIIPVLNKKLLKTSKSLDFPFSFSFDLDFNPTISHLGIEISADTLSTGEQKKMNLIVLLGIIELIKLKHHTVNLLFLDEIFSSLDVESIYKVVDLLKDFSKTYNMTVFVISHDPLPEELFDRKLKVQKIDHFSDILYY